MEPSGEGLGDPPGGVSASSPRSRSRIALLVVLARQRTHFWFWKRSPQSSTHPVLNFVYFSHWLLTMHRHVAHTANAKTLKGQTLPCVRLGGDRLLPVLRDGGGTRPPIHTPTRQGNHSPGHWPDLNALFRKISAAKTSPLGQLGVFLLQHKSQKRPAQPQGSSRGGAEGAASELNPLQIIPKAKRSNTTLLKCFY